MILLYLDESGSLDNPDDYFVVGGVAIDEADLSKIRRRIEIIVRRHLREANWGMELHASRIRGGRGAWGRIPHATKDGLLGDIPRLLGSFQAPSRRPYALFATARAPHAVPGADPLERTFEEVLLRFTEMLVRESSAGLENLGIVIADEAKYEKILQPLVESWREIGTSRRVRKRLARLVEVPLFVDSRATRLIQMADFVAHAAYRSYTAGDDSLFAPLLPRFDTRDGVLHGLVHLTPAFLSCPCPACVSRSTAAAIKRQGRSRPRVAAAPPSPIRRIRPASKQ